jgi:hypothetical protein
LTANGGACVQEDVTRLDEVNDGKAETVTARDVPNDIGNGCRLSGADRNVGSGQADTMNGEHMTSLGLLWSSAPVRLSARW